MQKALPRLDMGSVYNGYVNHNFCKRKQCNGAMMALAFGEGEGKFLL